MLAHTPPPQQQQVNARYRKLDSHFFFSALLKTSQCQESRSAIHPYIIARYLCTKLAANLLSNLPIPDKRNRKVTESFQ